MTATNNKQQSLSMKFHQYVGNPLSKNKSVFFISFHKCATSFFTNYVLKHLTGLTQIDHQNYLYQNNRLRKIKTRPFGYAYGIIRVLEKEHPLYRDTELLLNAKSLKKCNVLFLIRDPRDILVSMYYSFGFTHSFSPNKEIEAFQRIRRDYIQQMTIDQYVLQEGENIRIKYQKIIGLMEKINHYSVLKYEDLIENFDLFFEKMNEVVKLTDEGKTQMYKQTRPKKVEDLTSHKRSGKTGEFKTKLLTETREQLNLLFKDILCHFHYPTE